MTFLLPLIDAWGTNRFGNFCKLRSIEALIAAERPGQVYIETTLDSGGAGPKLMLSRADAAALAAELNSLLLK
jgi:hypothetical protein